MVALPKNALSRGVFALPLILALTSCELMEPAASPASASGKKSSTPAFQRFSAEELSDWGLQEAWYVEHDEAIESAFLIDAGLLLVTPPRDDGKRVLKMLRREDGTTLWDELIGGPLRHAPFAYTYPAGVRKPPELIFSIEDTVHCLDLRYGARMWSKTVLPPISTRVVADEQNVFFGTESSRLFAVPKASATDVWTYVAGRRVEAAPLFSPQHVVFGSEDGVVYGMTPDQGWVSLKSWKRATSGPIRADLASYGRWVFVGSTDYKLYCIEGADGSVFWSFVAGGPIEDPPVVYRIQPNREFVYCIARQAAIGAGTGKRRLFAIPLPKGPNVASGTAIWSREGVRRVVSAGKNTLYVLDEIGAAGQKRLTGLDVETGEQRLQVPLDGVNFVPFNSADSGRDQAERSRIYLISKEGRIQVLREKP